MKKFLNSKNFKISVMSLISGFIFATGALWAVVGLGFAPIQLAIPSTVVLIGLVFIGIIVAFIALAVDVTKVVFAGGTPSWGGILALPLVWLWVLASLVTVIGLYVVIINAFGTLWQG